MLYKLLKMNKFYFLVSQLYKILKWFNNIELVKNETVFFAALFYKQKFLFLTNKTNIIFHVNYIMGWIF